MLIYKLSNASASVDGPVTAGETQQVYIGSTTETLKRRMSRHHYKAKIFGNRKLYAAMNQSGDWKIEMLKDCGIVTKAELLQEELRFIDEYDSIRRGLNTLRPIR